jgi:hypothetical protein
LFPTNGRGQVAEASGDMTLKAEIAFAAKEEQEED